MNADLIRIYPRLSAAKNRFNHLAVCKIMDCFNHLDQSSFLEKFMVLDLPWSVFKETSSRCLPIQSLAALAQ